MATFPGSSLCCVLVKPRNESHSKVRTPRATPVGAHVFQVPSPIIIGRDKRLESVGLHSGSIGSGKGRPQKINYNNSDRLRHQRTDLTIVQL